MWMSGGVNEGVVMESTNGSGNGRATLQVVSCRPVGGMQLSYYERCTVLYNRYVPCFKSPLTCIAFAAISGRRGRSSRQLVHLPASAP